MTFFGQLLDTCIAPPAPYLVGISLKMTVPVREMFQGFEQGSDRVFESFGILPVKTLLPALVLGLPYFLAAVLVHPFVDLPFHDDWTYAWSVEHLLKTGELRILDWSVHYPFVQILWGTLFCLPYGFSFSALRVSTVVLAWLGALALYGTLRDFGRSRTESVIAAFLLIANPVFFVLTFSFMTDVPFMSLSNIAFFFAVRGLSRKSPFALWVGCSFGAEAFLIRQIAIAIPAALLLYVLFAPSYRSWRYVLPPAAFSLVVCLIPFFIAEILGVTTQYAGRTWIIDLWLSYYNLAVPGLLRILTHIGLALLPITLAVVASLYRQPFFWITSVVLLLLTASSLLFSAEIPRPLEGMWYLWTLGKERHLLRGSPALDFLPSWFNHPLYALSLFSSAAIVLTTLHVSLSSTKGPLGLFVWYTFVHFLLIMGLWLFDPWGSDRYSIVLLPPLIVILAGSRFSLRITLAGIVILYVLSMLVTWNETQTSRAIAAAAAWLREKNIPLANIDAGYVFNGWNLYAHPENLASGAVPARDVPLVTSKEKTPYMIAASPVAGYSMLREYGWSIPFRSLNYKIYVLEQLSDRGIIKDKVP